MSQTKEVRLKESLQKLEESADRLIRTGGYTSETRGVRLLVELIKEQIQNENSRRSTRPIG